MYIDNNDKPESNSLYMYTYLANKADSEHAECEKKKKVI